jgi:hypothetical protein
MGQNCIQQLYKGPTTAVCAGQMPIMYPRVTQNRL